MKRGGQLRIGISGWTYPPWRGVFFPPRWPQKSELAFASRQVNSIEINGTFYSLQRPESFAAWHAAVPDDFVFSVKGPRFITHLKQLNDVEIPLANFFASGVLRLGAKLGPILWQFPPRFQFRPEKLGAFFDLLPRSTAEAAALATRHDQRLAGRAWTQTDADRPLRHACEVRHESFRDAEFVALLRRHGIALVAADTAGKWPLLEDLTAGFVYVRLHGDEELYVSGYTDAALDTWAAKIQAWRAGQNAPQAALAAPNGKPTRGRRDVFVYFDNDVKVRAPFDAMALAHRLGLPAPRPHGREAVASAEEARTAWRPPVSRRPR